NSAREQVKPTDSSAASSWRATAPPSPAAPSTRGTRSVFAITRSRIVPATIRRRAVIFRGSGGPTRRERCMRGRNVATALAAAGLAVGAYAVGATQGTPAATAQGSTTVDLWQTYQTAFKTAKYIDLTHTITPNMPVWKGFGPAKFKATVDPSTGKPYTYKKDGFEATHYDIATDQFGTQRDPPAHWAPEYPGIDELPATYAVRPLVVISIVDQVKKDPKYALTVDDIKAFEAANGTIPEGSVVMVRSDWSKKWTTNAAKA